MRCPDCSKFVSQETGEPETDLTLEDTRDPENKDPQMVQVTGTVRLTLNCADCGTELKEGTFEFDEEVEVPVEHLGDDHELEVDSNDGEGTERQDGKDGTPSRYRRTYYGVHVTAQVTCSCGKLDLSVELSDEMQASSFDEL